MKAVIARVSWPVVLVLLATTPLAAQATGTILGTVADVTGAVLPGAELTITNIETGVSRTTITNESGNYKVVRLLPGRYSIRGELPGFKSTVIEDALLQVNQEARYDLSLEVGEITQEVTVSGETVALVQTDDASVGQVVDHKKVVELPLNGRNYMQLITLGTGAAPITNAGGSPIASNTQREGFTYTISGQRSISMSFLVDGIENKSEFNNVPAMTPALDAIQEFKLQRNTMSAEFGAAAAVVNLAIKSGSNEFHGSLYHFHRNDVLDSSQFQDPVVDGKKQKPPFRLNQFGGSIGGPLVKDRTFFFFNYEGLRRRRGLSLTGVTIPTRVRSGDFSTLRDAGGNLIPIYDPLTLDPATGTRQQFPNNVIPADRLDPLAQQLLEFFPAPQDESAPPGVTNITTARNRARDDDQFHIRIDHMLSDDTTIFGRFSYFDSPILQPRNYAPISTSNFFMSSRNLVIGATHTFGPEKINEFRFGWNDDRSDVIPDWDGGNITQELGLQNLDPVEQQYGIPQTTGASFTGVGPFGWDVVSAGRLFQFSEILTLIRGNHTLKFGAEVRDVRPWEMGEDNAPRGTFSFSGASTAQLQGGSPVSGTGSDMADFVLGIPRVARGSTGSSITEYDRTETHLFIQDDWKMGPNLTLSLGLRWEYNMYGNPRDGKLESFCNDCIVEGFTLSDPPEFGQWPGKLLLTDTGDLRPQVWDPDWNNLAPRLGFAWTPFADKRTVLRGGFGIFYDRTRGDEINFTQHHPDKIQLSDLTNEIEPTFFMRELFPIPPPGFNGAPFVNDFSDRTPYVMQWNLNVQRKLGNDWMGEAAYVGSHGNKLSKRWSPNQAVPGPGSINSRVPFRRFGRILGSYRAAISNYNSLQLKAEKAFSHGFHFISGYTFSRSQDLDSAGSFGTDNQNVNDRRSDYALSGFHVQNRFNLAFGYELPFGRDLTGAAGKLVQGWQINSILQLQDGHPFTARNRGDPANVGERYLGRTDRVCDGNLPDSQKTVDRWFDTSCFVPVGRFGNAGRNVIFTDGFKGADISIFKNTYFTETAYVQFRAEFFNAFNFTNHVDRQGWQVQRNFGKILAEGDAREIQFGLRIVF